MSELPLPREIRCVLVPVGNLRLLLPNATVAEVITLPAPSRSKVRRPGCWVALPGVAGACRCCRLPSLPGPSEGDSEQAVRVAVLKALGGHAEPAVRRGHHAGLSAPDHAQRRTDHPHARWRAVAAGVRAQVLVRDDVAVIPDLEGIEAELIDLLALAS